MNTNAEHIEDIRNYILTNKKPSYQTTNKKEVSVRCPYCGDSKSNKSATHFYIEMKPPFRFHCFKCESSGVLNNSTLRDLGIFESEISMNIINTNKALKSNLTIGKINFRKRNLINEAIESVPSVNAVNYFNSRFGTNFSNEYITDKFKAITDPVYFIQRNNLYIKNQGFNFADAIGFISADASHIIFRDISGTQSRRYYNLNLDDSLDDASKIYNISGELDLLEPEINLVIAEGIFDIVGVYTNFYKNIDNNKNTIFAAACGKGYNSVILKYLRMGFLNLNVTIFSDGDVGVNFYKNMKELSPYMKNSRITIYYNDMYNPQTGENKDFGTTVDKIRLKKIII